MAESQGDSQDKQFEATPQRREKAREEGNVPQSKETNGFALVVSIIICAFLFKAWAGGTVFSSLSVLLERAEEFSNDIFTNGAVEIRAWIIDFLLAIVPLFGLAFFIVLAALVAQRSIVFSLKRIKLDISKLSPADNLKKRYGATGITDFFKDALKMLATAAIAGVFLYRFSIHSFAASSIQRGQLGSFVFDAVLEVLILVAVFQAVLAAIDLPLQQQLHSNKLRMSREELKEEAKQSEGDPQLKQMRREKAKSVSRSTMLANAKEATVILVNPTHYAVALKWYEDSATAPVCVAKGIDHLAAAIREVAQANGIPIYRDPPSARSVYELVEIDEEIRPQHFAAVAAAIHFARSLKGHA